MLQAEHFQTLLIFHGFGHLGDFIDTVAFVAFTVGRPASVNGRLVPMDFSIYFIPTHLIITISVEYAQVENVGYF